MKKKPQLIAALTLAAMTALAGCASDSNSSQEGQPPVRSSQVVDNDGQMASNIYTDFMKKSIANQSHVNVNVFNSRVLLTGQVPSKELKQELHDIAANTKGQKGVYDAVKVAENTSDWRHMHDSWITGRVKRALDIDSDRVLVLTENSTVYLMGMVYDYEATSLAKQAASVGGVNGVVKAFQIINK